MSFANKVPAPSELTNFFDQQGFRTRIRDTIFLTALAAERGFVALETF